MTDALTVEFQKIMIPLRAAFKAASRARMEKLIERFEPSIVGQPSKMYDYRNEAYPHRQFLSRVFMAENAIKYGSSRPSDPLVKVSAETIEKLIEKESEYQASMAFDGFINKNVEKMNGILKARDVESVSHSINGIDGEMRVVLVDGSSFRMTFSVEYATSKFGVFFARFPTRFHDVVNAEGVKIVKSASEKKMKEIF